MQGELRKILRDHRDHARVVRTGRYFAEDHLFALNKQLDTEDTTSAERFRYLARNLARFFFCHRAHGLGLPGFAIVAVDLHVSDRFQERGATDMANRQLRNLVIEIHEPFYDNLAGTGASALLRIMPGTVDIFFFADHALPVAA